MDARSSAERRRRSEPRSARRASERGFSLIEISFVMFIVGLIASFQIPGLLEAQRDANESSAQGDLRAILSAQELFREGDHDKDGVRDYALTLTELFDTGLFLLKEDTPRRGYVFYMDVFGTGDSMSWYAYAEPLVEMQSGRRFFGMGPDGVLRYSYGGPATEDASPIGGGLAGGGPPPGP